MQLIFPRAAEAHLSGPYDLLLGGTEGTHTVTDGT